jgi:rhamnosyltransferase
LTANKLSIASSVLAVVVTYQPDKTLERNLRALRSQVDRVVVVDNGSINIAEVAFVVAAVDCELICNKTNLGVATAFNQGIGVANEEGFPWVITFDQDSLVPPGLVAGLLDLYRTHPRCSEIGVIAPTHRDRGTGDSYYQRGDRLVEQEGWRIVRSCISSGCLVPTAVYAQVGGLDDRLFIDFVDHDFCIRCRARGFLIVESTREVLEHSIGAAVARKVLGRRLVFTNHSPLRHYYMTRNQLEVYRRSMRVDFFWAARGLVLQAITALLVLIYEKQRLAKFRSMLEGMKDFALRRFGPRQQ